MQDSPLAALPQSLASDQALHESEEGSTKNESQPGKATVEKSRNFPRIMRSRSPPENNYEDEQEKTPQEKTPQATTR